MLRAFFGLIPAMVLIVGAANAQEPAAAGTAPVPKTEKPDVKVGDKWTFLCGEDRHKKNRVWVVTSVDQTGIKGTEDGSPLSLTPELNSLETPRDKHVDYRWLSFPLEIGKQWKATTRWTFGEYQGSETLNASVVGYEKIKVQAGEFDAFKLKYKSSWSVDGDGSGSNTNTYWYAPAARAIVKYDLISSGIAGDACELVEFQIGQ
jgi:hypothetical protein